MAIFFIGGTTILFGGAAVAASMSPTSAHKLHMTTTHAAPSITPGTSIRFATTSKSARKTSHQRSSKAKTTAIALAPVTYTVRPGDTLSGIAAWFKLRGYGKLYAANAKVIGANPNLIRPGERITIGSHVMKMQGPR